MSTHSQARNYDPFGAVTFRKTRERYGGLSNMATGFPLVVNGIHIPTSEALYQACRYPDRPDLQCLIIEQRSPMTAKMKAKRFISETRHDWDSTRVTIMRWCLRVKLAQNWDSFGSLLLSTANSPIVEDSRKDEFWGAKRVDDGNLRGINAMGRLLMELREELKQANHDHLKTVAPPLIAYFVLYGQPIRHIRSIKNTASLEEDDAARALDGVGTTHRKHVIQSTFW